MTKYEKIYSNIDNLSNAKQLVVGDSLLKNASNDHDMVYALIFRAHTEMYADDYKKSYSYLEKADSIVDRNNFKKEKITTLNMMNGIYKNLQLYSNFYDNIKEIDKILQKEPQNEYYKKVKGANLLSLGNYYSFIKDHEKSLIEYNRCIDHLEKNKFYNIALVKAHNDLGMLYADMKNFDKSTEIFNKMHVINTKHVNNNHFKMLYYLNVAVNYKILKDYNKSKQLLEQGIELANKLNIEFYKSSLNEQLAIIYEKLGEEDKSETIDKAQLEKSKEVYKNKLEANREVSNDLNNKSKEKIENINTSLTLVLIILVIVILVASGIIYFQIKNKKEIKDKFNKIIEDYQNQIDTVVLDDKILQQDNKLIAEVMSKAKEKEIIEALHVFENEKRFLDNDMSMSNLATDLNTNIKYVSYILKKYRNSNYNNYINQLRVDYLINLLIEDPKLRNYKLDYLANLVGFSNNSRLTNVFKQYKGISPSIFIKNLA